MNLLLKGTGSLAAVLLATAAVAAYKPTTAFQMGAPGVGMEVIATRERLATRVLDNRIPMTLPPAPEGGQLSVDAYQNVQVLGHVSSAEMTRLMTAMTLWVAPKDGCGYCHAPQRDTDGKILKNDDGYALADPNKMYSDELYTKRVARRMLQMVQRINGDWKAHVKETGVTCYTCHHGNPVPANLWYDIDESADYKTVGRTAGQNHPSLTADLSSLPEASLRPFLAGNESIRVQSTEAMDSPSRTSIKQAEWTFSLMVHMSNSLGVNCTYCHNTRSMGDWSTSPVQRTTAWYGIRMVREINADYLEPLLPAFPPERLGPLGDAPKANCATCHAGAYKPLLGVSMLKDYQVLAKAMPQPAKSLVAAPAPVTEEMTGAVDGGTSAVIAHALDGGTIVGDGGRSSYPTAGDGGSALPPSKP